MRFWQPTSACMTCMSGSWGNIASLTHWEIALRTGLLTGSLALLLTFTPAVRLYSHRYGNAVLVGMLTALGDVYSHSSTYGHAVIEHCLTGLISGLLTLGASFLLEDSGRRPRAFAAACATWLRR